MGLIIIIVLLSPFMLIILLVYAEMNHTKHSIEKENNSNKDRQDRAFAYALNIFTKGNFKDLEYWYGSSRDISIQTIVKIAQAIGNNSPATIQKIARKAPSAYLKIEPTLPEAYIICANQLFRKQNFSSAIKWYKMYYELKKDNRICSYLGFYYLRLHDYSNANLYLKEALTYKKTFSVLYNLFIVNVNLKQYKEAFVYFSELRKKFSTRLEKKDKFLTKIPLEQLQEEIL